MNQVTRERLASIVICIIATLISGCFDLGGSEPVADNNVAVPPPPPPPPPATNSAPTITGVPTTTAMVGNPWSFTPNATDVDNDPLTFTIQNQPPWATFDAAMGTLSGVPQLGQEGDYPDIVVSVSDGNASAALPEFTLTVRNSGQGSNTAPQISGIPSTSVMVDQMYDFTPGATDPDNDTLTFMIAGMPPWATFEEATGRLSGTPEALEEGVYENVVISVSDGELMAALPAFSITVTAAATGAVTLTWTPPTMNTDGTILTDLIAYKFYYGLSEGNYPNEIRVDNPGLSSYVIDNLAPNTYYFVTSVVNSSEVESDFSNVTSTTVLAN